MVQIFLGVIGALLLTLAVVVVSLNWVFPLIGAKFLRGMLRKKAGLVQKELTDDGHRVPYLVGGTGEALILVHGFTSNKDNFDAVARYLTPSYTLYALDLPGFGDADRDPNADYGIEAFVTYVRQFSQALGLKRLHLCGSSMGGGVVAHFAARFPDEVASLWLIDAAATREFLTDSEMIKQYNITGKFPYLVRTHEEHVRKMEIVFGGRVKMPNCVEFAFANVAIRDFEIHSTILKKVLLTPPIESMFSGLKTPALIVTGDKDLVVPPSSAQTLAKVFPNSSVVVMASAGHLPMVEYPRQSAQDYLAFRAELAAR